MNMTPLKWMIAPLRRYAQFNGRARRAEYWWFFLFCSIANNMVGWMESLLVGPGIVTRHVMMIGALPITVTEVSNRVIGTIVAFALFVPQLTVAVRRLHDVDETGWWLLVPLTLAISCNFLISVRGGFAIEDAGPMIILTGLTGVGAVGFAALLFAWACTRGTAGWNDFGADPLADD